MNGDSFGDTLEFDGYEFKDGVARLGFTVGAKHRQPMGIVHGGAYASLAESVASRATNESVNGAANCATGQTNETSFLRPIASGRVQAEAKVKHQGRTTWVWDIEITDEQGRLCALSRMTVAVRPIPPEMAERAAALKMAAESD